MGGDLTAGDIDWRKCDCGSKFIPDDGKELKCATCKYKTRGVFQ